MRALCCVCAVHNRSSQFQNLRINLNAAAVANIGLCAPPRPSKANNASIMRAVCAAASNAFIYERINVKCLLKLFLSNATANNSMNLLQIQMKLV